jgi:small subunit ribosomal protein S20
MATHKSAEKRNRQNKKRNLRNRENKSALKTAVASARTKIDKNEKSADLAALVSKAASMLAKVAHRGSIHWKKASRKTSRLQLAMNKSAAGK